MSDSTLECMFWRGVDRDGLDACRVQQSDAGWVLSGKALFIYHSASCALDYRVVCDPRWRTLSATVNGWTGSRLVDLRIARQPGQRWLLNDVEVAQMDGCIDLELGFTPATNLIAIRRLALAPGQRVLVTAAYLSFPELELRALDQSYHRTSLDSYAYETTFPAINTQLAVNPAGFVTDYPGLWRAEASARQELLATG